MRFRKFLSALFAACAAGIAGLTVYISLVSLHASPVMLAPSQTAVECARNAMDAICCGDYAHAGRFFYGKPTLGSGDTAQNEAGRLIWNAFVDSLEYEFTGDCYPSESGLCQNVRIRSLEMASVTRNLQERSRKLLSARMAEAEDVDEIYDGENNYREDFVMEILSQAVQDALKEDARYSERELTLSLIYDRDRWWVLPDQQLIHAVSGDLIG